MGSIWLADHLTLHTQVVVKFIAAEHALNVDARLRFEREAALAAQAKSPHVVQIFDHGVAQQGLPYIAMELLEGEDLARRIDRDRVIDPDLFADWLKQACRGLARAHGKGIVHRDIKPENIFLCDSDGEVLVKLLDFGIAKGELGTPGLTSTSTGTFLGTAYYMSPEQALGERDIDLRSDLWALGVVAFHALTGARPFQGDSIGQVIVRITSAELPPASSRNPRLGRELDAWFAKALARPREQRFQSAKELADAFASSLSADRLVTTIADAPPAPLQGAIASNQSPADRLRASTMAPAVRNGGGVLPRQKPRNRRLLAGAVLAAAATLTWLLATRSQPEPVAAVAAAASVAPARAAPLAAPAEPPSPAPTVANVEAPSRPSASATPPSTPSIAMPQRRPALLPKASAHPSSAAPAAPVAPAPASQDNKPLRMQIE